MLPSNKKWLAGIAAVIAILLVSLTLLAQEHPNKNNHSNNTYDSPYRNSNVPEEYWLSDDQISRIDNIKAEYDELIQPEIEKYNSVRDEYFDYRQQDEISRQRIREYQTELRYIEDNIYSLKTEAANKIRNIFGKTQLPYYNNSAYDNWCDNWGWNYNGYMNYGTRDHGYMDYGWGCGHRDHGMRDRCCW